MTDNIKVLCDRDDIVAIADAVRNKTGVADEMTLGGIVNCINDIPSGGEDVTAETEVYTTKIASLETAVTALETELQGKAGGGGSGENKLAKLVSGEEVELTAEDLQGATSIHMFMFYECSHLSGITIPDTVTAIGESAFYNCSSLSDITIPDSVVSIGLGAFDACTGLINVHIGSGLTTIGYYAFYYCTELPYITIPDNVQHIEYGAFEGCSNLESITIGEGVTFIGEGAFVGCTNLRHIYYTGTEEQWNAIEIESGNELLTNATIHYNWEEK